MLVKIMENARMGCMRILSSTSSDLVRGKVQRSHALHLDSYKSPSSLSSYLVVFVFEAEEYPESLL